MNLKKRMSNVIYKKDTRRGVRFLICHQQSKTTITRDDSQIPSPLGDLIVIEGYPVEIAIDADEIVIERLQEIKVG